MSVSALFDNNFKDYNTKCGYTENKNVYELRQTISRFSNNTPNTFFLR